MANTNVSHDEVKSICDKLECSPSANFTDSPYGGQAKIGVGAVPGHAADEGGTQRHMGQASQKSKKVPGYKGKFAKKATQV